MNSPSAALTWEIWCRHRKRLVTLVSVILGFALFYPKLCEVIGLNLTSPNALDDIIQQGMTMQGSPSRILQMLAWVFCICAPAAGMVISLFYVAWIFTFTDLNPREPLSFPKRYFTLPISTGFLASRLMASGAAAVWLVYLGWTRLVHLPHIPVFDGFTDGLSWITLVILAQAIVWSLDAFPFTRMLVLMVTVFFLLAHPDFHWYRTLESHQTPVELSLIVIGGVLGFAGLGKIRHGGWQKWFWVRWLPLISARRELRGPKVFRSAAQAQFWFEWRRQGRRVFYSVFVLAVVPVLVMIPEFLLHPGPGYADATCQLCIYLMFVPLFIHFCQGFSHEKTMPQFIVNRPLNNDEIIVAQWKVMALTTVLSWVVTGLLVGIVMLTGDPSLIYAKFTAGPEYERVIRPLFPVILLGMVFATWAVGTDRVWVGAVRGTWIYRIYGAIIFTVLGIGFAGWFAVTHPYTSFHDTYFLVFPNFLAWLVGLKFFLAQWAFRAAYKKRLIARRAQVGYLGMWILLAALFLVPFAVVCHRSVGFIPFCLVIILLLPLARIGFAPLALDYGRHR